MYRKIKLREICGYYIDVNSITGIMQDPGFKNICYIHVEGWIGEGFKVDKPIQEVYEEIRKHAD